MTQQTPNLGLTYPEAGDHTRIWEYFQQLAEDTDDAISGVGAKQVFTPTWRQDGGSTLSIGDGTLVGHWQSVGLVATASILMVRGSTTNVGSAGYLWSIPAEFANDYRTINGYGVVARGATYWPLVVVGINSTTVRAIRTDDRSRVSNDSPGSWTAGDIIHLMITGITT